MDDIVHSVTRLKPWDRSIRDRSEYSVAVSTPEGIRLFSVRRREYDPHLWEWRENGRDDIDRWHSKPRYETLGAVKRTILARCENGIR